MREVMLFLLLTDSAMISSTANEHSCNLNFLKAGVEKIGCGYRPDPKMPICETLKKLHSLLSSDVVQMSEVVPSLILTAMVQDALDSSYVRDIDSCVAPQQLPEAHNLLERIGLVCRGEACTKCLTTSEYSTV